MHSNTRFSTIKLVLFIAAALTVDGFIVFARPHLPGLILGLCAGLLIFLPVIFRFRSISRVLQQLAEARKVDLLPERLWDPFSTLARDANRLADARYGIASLRENFLSQARDTAAQQERNRLARELHDSIKQQLFSIQMSAAAAETRLSGDNEQARPALADVRESAQEALVEMNALLQQLSPAPLEKVGLVQAVRDQCEALGYRSGAQVSCEIDALPPDGALLPGTQEAIFRMVQEALSNIARHARAGQVCLKLSTNESARQIELQVWDNGQGFDPDQVAYGSGIASIRERADRLGGRAALNSHPGQGTTLSVFLPYTLPSVETDTDLPPSRPNPALNKTMLVGILGGLAIAVLMFNSLYIPHYRLFSPAHLAPLPAEEIVIFSIIEAALAGLTGWLAGRWVGRQTILAGAASGAVAGITAYGCIGGAWSAAEGARLVLVNAASQVFLETQAINMLVAAFCNIFWSTHLLFWAFLLAGAGLGALGGLLAGRKDAGREDPPLAEIDFARYSALLLAPLLVAGEIAALAAVLLMSLFEGAVRDAYRRGLLALQPGWVIDGTVIWAIAIPAALCLLAMGIRYAQLRGELEDPARLPSAVWEAFFLAFCGLAGGVLNPLWVILWNNNDLSVNQESIPAAQASALVFGVGCTALGVLSAALFVQALWKMSRAQIQRPPTALFVALILGLLAPVLGLLALLTGSSSYGYAALAALAVAGILLLYLAASRSKAEQAARYSAARAARELAARVNDSWLAMIYSLVLPVLAMGSAGLGAARMVTVLGPILIHSAEQGSQSPVSIQAFVSENYFFQWADFAVLVLLAGIAVGFIVLAANLRAYSLRKRL